MRHLARLRVRDAVGVWPCSAFLCPLRFTCPSRNRNLERGRVQRDVIEAADWPPLKAGARCV